MYIYDIMIHTYIYACIYIYIYIKLYIIIHHPPFINHFNNSQGFTQNKSTHFYFAKFVMTPVKGFCLVREMQDWILKIDVSRDIPVCHALLIYSFFSQEKDTEKLPKIEVKHVIENLFLLFEVIAREHVGMQHTLVLVHESTQGTLAHEHVSSQDKLAGEHVSLQDTLPRE